MFLLKPLAAAAALSFAAFGASAAVYDVAADFSTASNPNGVWSYGETNGFGGAFTLFTDNSTITPGLQSWMGASPTLLTPFVYHNATAAPISLGSPVYGPFEAGFHPGPSARDATYRFTAPAAGLYAFNGIFYGQDTAGTTTEVGIFLNGAQQGSLIQVNGFGTPTTPFVATFSLAAGGNIDVSVGNRGSFFNDSTGLAVTIAAVPEPETVALMLAGLGVVGFAAKRRQG